MVQMKGELFDAELGAFNYFISHMVQMKDITSVNNTIYRNSFISHMVQMKDLVSLPSSF